MRTIKCRAWHIEEKKMCEVSIINFESGAFLKGAKPGKDQIGDKYIVPAPTGGRFCWWDEFKLMQFTGLTDKNGVECYEGDIVFWKHLGEYGVVYFNDEELAYFVKPIKTERETESCLDSTHMEVIGNIHENPELIQH